VAYALFAAFAFVGILHGGIGKPAAQLTPDRARIGFKYWYICEVMFGPLVCLIRTSACLFFMRVCRYKAHKFIIAACLSVVWLSSTIYLFIALFQCSPPKWFWEQFSVSGSTGSCQHTGLASKMALAHSFVLAISDFALGLLPVIVLWNVQINVRKKAVALILLSLGLL
jgi:hypothetical protein